MRCGQRLQLRARESRETPRAQGTDRSQQRNVDCPDRNDIIRLNGRSLTGPEDAKLGRRQCHILRRAQRGNVGCTDGGYLNGRERLDHCGTQ